MVKRATFCFFLACVFLFSFFWFNARKGLDPDFGWHIRMGQLIATSGIPRTDPFSYTMSYYPVVGHEWLIDLGIALVYPVIGLTGLTFLAISIAFAALLFQTFFIKKQWILVPFLLAGTALTGYLGVRPQLISWLFVSVLLVLFLHDKLWRHFRFFLPLLMFLWVNVHGSFALGVMLIGLVIVVKQIQAKKLLVVDWLLFLFTVAVTGLTPYGWRPWWEVWMSLSDSGLRWAIQEWLPAFFIFNMSFMLLLPLSVLLVFRYRRRFSLLELVLYGVLLFLGLSSSRHLPFWLLLSLSMTTKAIAYFAEEAQKNAFGRQSFPKAYTCLVWFVCFTVLVGFGMALVFRPSKQTASYPDKAIQFLKEHPTSGNVLSTYELGGYLIWKLPQKKVFIDGRMPSWRVESAPVGQSKNAFAEYNKVFGETTAVKPIFAKYHIDTVMFSRIEEPLLFVKASRFLRKFHILFPDMEEFKGELEKQGMQVVYKDKLMVIYRK